MLVQSLVIVNGGAAIAVLAYYGAHNAYGPGKSAALLTIILYCLGVFTAIFAGLYVSKMVRVWARYSDRMREFYNRICRLRSKDHGGNTR